MNAIAQVSAAPTTGPKLDNRRVLAAIVDLLIVAAGALVVLYAGDSLGGDKQGALGAVILGWALYYYFALESGDGQTVGKKLMKLRVVCADGRPAGMREIAVRTILRVVDGIGLYIVGLIVMMVTRERRQRIGDLAANTIVVDASAPTVAPPAPADAETVVEDEPETETEAAVAAEAEAADAVEAEHVQDAPVAAEPTQTITLPSRPAPPETLSDLAQPELQSEEEDQEPAAEVSEPAVEVDEPSAEVQELLEAEPAEVEPFEVKPFEPAPIDVDSLVPVSGQEEPAVEVEEPAAEVEEPAADQALPSAMSPSLEGLAADVAAAHDEDQAEDADEHQADPIEVPEDDGPVNVKSVETVSAMDLIMGAAEEDAAQPDEDEGPASA